jgi:transcriptional regulator with XRE-family HTH domain
MNTFSEWLKTRRKDMGLTQVQVATKLGVHQAQVSALEGGRTTPDHNLLVKTEKLFGSFSDTYTSTIKDKDAAKKEMPSAAMEALKAYREKKDTGFYLELEKGLVITADRNQYILRQGVNASYFTELKLLIKYMIASQIRQSSVDSVQKVLDKLDSIYELVEAKFNEYDPANIKIVGDGENV